MAEVAPELVVLDAEGDPYSVRYHVLPSLLLNEMQQQQRTITGLQQTVDAQRSVNVTLLARLDALETQLGGGRARTDR